MTRFPAQRLSTIYKGMANSIVLGVQSLEFGYGRGHFSVFLTIAILNTSSVPGVNSLELAL